MKYVIIVIVLLVVVVILAKLREDKEEKRTKDHDDTKADNAPKEDDLSKKVIESNEVVISQEEDSIIKEKGKIGELKVDEQLNLLIDEEGMHKHITNFTFVDSRNKSHQIDHVVIRENGIFCIETKNYNGWIYGNQYQRYWTQTFPNGSKFRFLNPLIQNNSHKNYLYKALEGKYIVNSVVIFVQNNIDRDRVKHCPNVINLEDLNKYLKICNDGTTSYSLDEISEIYDLLFDIQSEISEKEHIQNVEQTRKWVEAGKCPWCGGEIVERTARKGSKKGQKFYACSNFPKCWYKKR
jgi:ssDNA-binding Zn-finger/Zn-ribbon topoisomerase 1